MRMRDPLPRRAVPLAAMLGVLILWGAAAPAGAQSLDWNVPIRATPQAPDWRALPRTPCDKDTCGGSEGPSTRVPWNLIPSKFGAQIVEFKAAEVVGGVPQRARRGLAFESDGMRSMLNEIGFDATRCQAPVVRMHTKLRGGFASTTWVYARCALR